jgi:hypothetical protein
MPLRVHNISYAKLLDISKFICTVRNVFSANTVKDKEEDIKEIRNKHKHFVLRKLQYWRICQGNSSEMVKEDWTKSHCCCHTDKFIPSRHVTHWRGSGNGSSWMATKRKRRSSRGAEFLN